MAVTGSFKGQTLGYEQSQLEAIQAEAEILLSGLPDNLKGTDDYNRINANLADYMMLFAAYGTELSGANTRVRR